MSLELSLLIHQTREVKPNDPQDPSQFWNSVILCQRFGKTSCHQEMGKFSADSAHGAVSTSEFLRAEPSVETWCVGDAQCTTAQYNLSSSLVHVCFSGYTGVRVNNKEVRVLQLYDIQSLQKITMSLRSTSDITGGWFTLCLQKLWLESANFQSESMFWGAPGDPDLG